jgi:gliding motility-associated-like protein
MARCILILIAILSSFTARCQSKCDNLILNSDFANIDNVNCVTVDFKSDMILDCAPEADGWGYIFLDSTGAAWNGVYWAGVLDHTPGGGTNVLMGDGSEKEVMVWQQTVQVEKDSIYEISGWFINANVNGRYSGPTSEFEFRLDSADGTLLFTTGRLGKLDPWTQFKGNFTANHSGDLNLFIINLATQGGGNDFGIDDLKLRCLFTPEPCGLSSYDNLSICRGDSVVLQSDSGQSFSWNQTKSMSNEFISKPLVYPNKSTTYVSSYIDANDCNHLDSFFVSVLPVPDLMVLESTIDICLDDTVQLEALGAKSYEWSPEINISDKWVSSPWVFPEVKTTYVVHSRLNTGCETYDSVTVNPFQCNCTYYVPNAITANGDGLNEDFTLISDCHILDYHMSIYNRWGEKLFESIDQNDRWDGRYQSDLVQIGVYVYVINLTFINENADSERTNTSGIVHVIH